MRQALKGVWIGTSNDARNHDMLREQRVKAILNVAFDLDTPQYPDIQLFKAGLVDGQSSHNPVKQAVDLLLLIEQRIGIEGKVLVHCHSGKNRSPFVVAVWMARFQGWTFKEARLETELEYKPWMQPFIDKLLGPGGSDDKVCEGRGREDR